MINFILLFLSLFFTFLFFNVKITRIALLLAFKQEEEKQETSILLLIMVLATLFWSIYFSV